MKKSSPRFAELTPFTTSKYNVIIEATDTQTGEHVMIKTPRVAHVTNDLVCTNLHTEARMLQRIAGLPYVQRYITDGTEHDHGHDIPFLVTQKARGVTLYDLVRNDDHRGRLTHTEGIILLRSIASALFPAHELGIVHCDLKLGNILWDETTHTPTIMDWAAAIETGAQSTHTATVIGTAQFMSFEHVTGLSLDARTDIYALGIILTLLVYGQELTPRYTYVNGKAKKRSKDETADAVAAKETIKTELFDLPQSSYDWSLQQLLKRMTHWDREKRPRSMEEIVQECSRILA